MSLVKDSGLQYAEVIVSILETMINEDDPYIIVSAKIIDNISGLSVSREEMQLEVFISQDKNSDRIYLIFRTFPAEEKVCFLDFNDFYKAAAIIKKFLFQTE